MLVLSSGLTGCFGGGLEKFPVAPVKGRVLCDGQPVPHAYVHFEPLQSGTSAIVGKAAFGMADAQGNFVLSTYGDEDGAVVGKHRVRVVGPSGELAAGFVCDCQLGDNIDQMELEVTDGLDHEFDIELLKKVRKDRPQSPRERAELEEI
jgi:hypothetical protein